jgi:hypothetical protein
MIVPPYLIEPLVIPETICDENKLKRIIIGINEREAAAKTRCQFERKSLI